MTIDKFEDRIFDSSIEDFETRMEVKTTHKSFFPQLDDSEVNNPQHYNQGSVECIEALQSCMNQDEYRGFLKGNIIKYLWRMNDKATPQQNIAKARWYLDTLDESYL
jgi:hypothetical protein